jgi:hypothetical protein
MDELEELLFGGPEPEDDEALEEEEEESEDEEGENAQPCKLSHLPPTAFGILTF